MKRPELKVLFVDEVASKVSDVVSLEGAKRVTLLFTRTDHTAGSSVFSVEVSLDGITFITFNKLIDNVANTNAQTLTRVASSSLASATSKYYSMDLQHDYFKFMRVSGTVVTDGKVTAKSYIEYEN